MTYEVRAWPRGAVHVQRGDGAYFWGRFDPGTTLWTDPPDVPAHVLRAAEREVARKARVEACA